jgi:hypothetical protein
LIGALARTIWIDVAAGTGTAGTTGLSQCDGCAARNKSSG